MNKIMWRMVCVDLALYALVGFLLWKFTNANPTAMTLWGIIVVAYVVTVIMVLIYKRRHAN
jgi:uncharacterized membrane protein YeiB